MKLLPNLRFCTIFLNTQLHGNAAMQYRRTQTPGGTYFFTLVTFRRRKFLCEPENVDLLRTAFRTVKSAHPFTIDAFYCCRTICIASGPCRPATKTTRCAGMPSKTTSPAIARSDSNHSDPLRNGTNVRKLSGNHAIGNIKFETNATSKNTAITFIGIPSNTVWQLA